MSILPQKYGFRNLKRCSPIAVIACALTIGSIGLADAPNSGTTVEGVVLRLAENNNWEQAQTYLEIQIAAGSAEEKDLLVGQQLSHLALALHNRRDSGRAEYAATLAAKRTEPRLADTTLTALHFQVFREQALMCDVVMGSVEGALRRIDCTLRYLGQVNGGASSAVSDELKRTQARLWQQLKVQRERRT